MPRFILTIEYNGTRYSGWQIQKNARTVAGELERAIRTASGRASFELYGSGRTDAGVHAVAQVAHLQLDTREDPSEFLERINGELPADINVLAMERAPQRFHARHDAVARSYLYQISRRRTAFAKPFVWWVRDRLDIEAMREAAASFVGLKDFSPFTAEDREEISKTVLVDRVQITEDGPLILVRVEGSHFLWKMVRRIVGVLVEVGRGRLTPAAAAALLEGDSELPARLTAPSSGLFLERVYFRGDRRDVPVHAVMRIGR